MNRKFFTEFPYEKQAHTSKNAFENSQMAKYFYLAKFSKGKLPKPLYSSSLLLELFLFCFLASDFCINSLLIQLLSFFFVLCWSLFVFIVISVFWMPSVAVLSVFVCLFFNCISESVFMSHLMMLSFFAFCFSFFWVLKWNVIRKLTFFAFCFLVCVCVCVCYASMSV